MNEDPRNRKEDCKSLPVTMYWHNGPPTERVRKEDFAKRRPKMSKSVSIERIEVSPLSYLRKTTAADTYEESDDAAPARSDS